MTGRLALPEDSPLRRRLGEIASTERLVVVSGIPGAGKSLMVQQLALLAQGAGRRVHLFQWDVARTAFETPALLAKYPEADGITHPAIMCGVGFWIRDAIVAWHRDHPGPDRLLIGEAPLLGRRMIELAEPGPEPAESLLTGPGTRFLVPVPSTEVRRVMESRRALTSAAPRHAREAADALPHVVRASWETVFHEGCRAGVIRGPAPTGGIPYDPAAYSAVYRHWLQHRRVEFLAIEELLPAAGSVYDVGTIEGELRAIPPEVEALTARLEARFPPEAQSGSRSAG